MSDKKLKREINRRRQINELREMDRKEKLANSPTHKAAESIKKLALVLATVSGIFVTVNNISKNAPGVSNSVKKAKKFVESFIAKQGNVPVKDVIDDVPEAIKAFERYYMNHF